MKSTRIEGALLSQQNRAGASAEVVMAGLTKIGTIILAAGASARVVAGRFTKIGTTLMAAGASAEVVTGTIYQHRDHS